MYCKCSLTTLPTCARQVFASYWRRDKVAHDERTKRPPPDLWWRPGSTFVKFPVGDHTRRSRRAGVRCEDVAEIVRTGVGANIGGVRDERQGTVLCRRAAAERIGGARNEGTALLPDTLPARRVCR